MNKLLEALISEKLLTNAQAKGIEEKSQTTGKTADELILKEKFIPEEILYKAKERVFRVILKEPSDEVPPDILARIPEDTARYYKVVPLGEEDGGAISLGMVYPEDIKAHEAVTFLAERKGFSFRQYLITPSTFEKIVKRYRTLRAEVEEAVSEFEKEVEKELTRREKEIRKTLLEEITEEAPISKIVAVIMEHAVEGGASDVHIEPEEHELRIRFRHNGLLYPSITLPLKIHPAVVARIKILSGLRIDETRIPQDGKIHIEFSGRKIDIRVSAFPTIYGEKIVLRVLDPTVGLKKFEELGLEGNNLAAVRDALTKPYGFILSVGPTGSGKTTTLYAMINTLDKERYNIVTLEDPVEYVVEGVNQSQINPDIGYTFAQGLRYVLRQDPDIIMVGEIRDKETAALAIHASLTGHLMFSTLHTNDVFGAIPRLIHLGIDSFLIPPAMSVVAAQRLVPRLCEFCKRKQPPGSQAEAILKEHIGILPPGIFTQYGVRVSSPTYYSPGCKKCMFLKSSGRIGIFETLRMTKELANIILKEEGEGAMREEAKRQGYISMRQDGLLKALRGIVSVEAVMRETKE